MNDSVFRIRRSLGAISNAEEIFDPATINHWSMAWIKEIVVFEEELAERKELSAMGIALQKPLVTLRTVQ